MTTPWPESGSTPWDDALKSYIDTADVDTLASVAAGEVRGRITLNRTTTVATASNVAGAVFAVGANEIWTAEFNIQNGCSGTGGIKWAITVPSGATLRAVVHGNTSAITAFTSSVLTSSGTLTTQNYNSAASTVGFTRIVLTIVAGATAGGVQLQFASTTAGQTSTVYADSYFTARRL